MDLIAIVGGMLAGAFIGGNVGGVLTRDPLAAVAGAIVGGILGAICGFAMVAATKSVERDLKARDTTSDFAVQLVGSHCGQCGERTLMVTDAHHCPQCTAIFCKKCVPEVPCPACRQQIAGQADAQ